MSSARSRTTWTGAACATAPTRSARSIPSAYHWFAGDGMVHGLRPARRQGRVVSQPLRPRPAGLPGAGEPELKASSSSPGWREHQRDRPRRPHPGSWSRAASPSTSSPTSWTPSGVGLLRTLPGGYSAHPKRDPETVELHAVAYGMERGNTVQYSVIGVDGWPGAPSTSPCTAVR